MTDIWFPSWLCPRTAYIGLDDFTAADSSATTGSIQTSSIYGTRRWRLRMDFPSLSSDDGTLQIFEGLLAALHGKSNRIWISVPGQRRRGTFPASELLVNNTFANGTTGWTSGSGYTNGVSDRIMRCTRNAVSGGGTQTALTGTGGGIVSVAQYAPYAYRAMMIPGRGSFAGLRLDWNGYQASPMGGARRIAYSNVPLDVTIQPRIRDSNTAGNLPGDYFGLPYVSLSRCALVDNGPNALLQSDDLSTSWTSVRSSVVTNAELSPDGTTSADSIIEDSTASSSHLVEQYATFSSVATDYCFSVALKAGARTFAALQLAESTGNTNAIIYIDLATGQRSNGTPGANWSNVRSSASSLGNGWWHVSIIARKTNAATVIGTRIRISNSLSTSIYDGDGSSNIYAWRSTLAQSSVPTRLIFTTAASSAGAPQTGSGMYIKGLPASASGLARSGDLAEIILPNHSQLVRLTSPLNSDAAGMGYMQFEPGLRSSPADNAAVIFHEPMGRFLLASGNVGTELRPGVFGESSLEFVEA